MKRLRWVLGLLGLATAVDAQAQDERHLKQVFEGRRITVLIDMPATDDGIDIVPGSSRPLDFQKYSGRLKKHGIALREGDRSMITKIRVKDDIIEVQLDGGGFGTAGDLFNSVLTNNGADSGAAQQLKISNERTQRQSSGSRFNLRFPNGMTPDDLEPTAIIKALAEYATFPASVASKTERESAPAATPVASQAALPAVAPPTPPTGTAGTSIRKGMSDAEVEAIAGKPLSEAVKGPILTRKYKWVDGSLEADFVNGIVVGYRISST